MDWSNRLTKALHRMRHEQAAKYGYPMGKFESWFENNTQMIVFRCRCGLYTGVEPAIDYLKSGRFRTNKAKYDTQQREKHL